MSKVGIILGTMQFGERVFGDDAEEMLKVFTDAGYNEIDTAYVYNDGQSECIIGNTIQKLVKKPRIATKVNPRVTGKLDEETVVMQFHKSLERMKCDAVDLLYLHFPDPDTDIRSALGACDRLHAEGKFKELGLSNFPAWLVGETCNICKEKGWVRPTVYEGLYNPLSRHAERELNTALNYYNIRFYAYNPLAGGLLTEKYFDKVIKEGRFTNRPNYQERYWHDSFFKAIEIVRNAADKEGVGITEAAFRWLSNHSMLNENRGDGIIVGASSLEQLKHNISYIEKGELSNEMLTAFETAWNMAKADAPEYFKYF